MLSLMLRQKIDWLELGYMCAFAIVTIYIALRTEKRLKKTIYK